MIDKPVYIIFEELNLVMCKAKNKRKIVNPILDKICLHSVPIFYGMGYVFRDKKNTKKYYSVEEVEEIIKKHLSA